MITIAQRRALQLVANGYRNKQIAQDMGITVRTVDSHLQSARIGLKAKTTAHAVANGIRAGILNSLIVVLVGNACFNDIDMVRINRRPPTARVRVRTREIYS